MEFRSFTAVVEREGDGYVAFCPELDVVSQGNTVEEARANLCAAQVLSLALLTSIWAPAEPHTPCLVVTAGHAG